MAAAEKSAALFEKNVSWEWMADAWIKRGRDVREQQWVMFEPWRPLRFFFQVFFKRGERHGFKQLKTALCNVVYLKNREKWSKEMVIGELIWKFASFW